MKLKYLLAASVMGLATATVVPTPVAAQQITSGIEGQVTTDAGAPVAGATVTITDTRTNQERVITTGTDGRFRTDGLTTGGPYTVTALSDGLEGQTVQDIFINLQGNTQLTFTLNAAATEGDVIVVTGARAQLTQLAIGPGTSFGTETIEAFPSITRDVRDIIRIDPRVSLDRANEVDRVSCLGGNDRTNAFTVDGIAQSDLFGLNGTPFASRNSLPLPYDAVRETSVEFAPFDVQYGDFTGCAINVVTKSGTNEFSGSAFFTFASDDLRGTEADGRDFTGAPFKEYRWGATLGGPIIPDRLFFFGAYEETDLGDSFEFGPAGQGFANELDYFTVDQFNRFSQILSDTYGIESGGIPVDLRESSRRFFGRVDLLINDRNRFEATYQRLEETNVESDDFSDNNNVYTGLNSFEDEGTVSDYYSARLFSDWTDNFSTELRVSYADVGDVQGPVGGGEAQSDNPIPRIVVGVTNGDELGSFVAGPGFSRTSNELNTQVLQVRALGRITGDRHTLTFGGDFNQLDVFNLFAQNSTGTLTFNNLDDFAAGLLSPGIDDFPTPEEINDGTAAGAYGNFTASGDINDAAAEWKRRRFAAFVQDDWSVTDRLNLLLGVRVEWLSGDAPTANPAFFDRYGFTNAFSFGQVDPEILPRIAATYQLDNDGFFSGTQVTAGVGRFSGGDPAVYFSNAFSNNGFSTGFARTGQPNCIPAGTQGDVVVNGQFTGIPDCVIALAGAQAAEGGNDTQSTDPSFEQPTVWRANVGLSTRFGTETGFFSDWRLNLDYIYSRFENPIDFVDLSQTVDTRLGLNGFTVDGRPIYRAINPANAGCTAELLNQGGRPPQYVNVNTPCFNTTRDDEIQLTNGLSFDTHVASAILTKDWRRGLFTEEGGINFSLGYAYTDAENNRYNNSSTATSSFDIVAAADRQAVDVARSEYASSHNISFGLNFREAFFGEYDTSFGFVAIARSGRPYSIVFQNATGAVLNDSASGNNNSLLYIPTGIGDPNVVIADAAFATALDNFISENDCINEFRGRTIERNSCENEWFFDLDLRFSQELPGPLSVFGVKQDEIRFFADFDNFLNLLDSDWNTFRSFGYAESLVRANVDAQGRYVYTPINGQYDASTGTVSLRDPIIGSSSSLWRIQLGVSYEF